MSYCYEQNKCVKVWREAVLDPSQALKKWPFALSTQLEDGRTARQVRGKGPKTEGLACLRNRSTGQTSSTYFLCEKAMGG